MKYTKSMKKAVLAVSGTVALAAAATGLVSLELALGRSVYRRDKKKNEQRAKGLPPAQPDPESPGVWYDTVHRDAVSINNRASEPIFAEYIHAEKNSGLWVICIHGYTSDPPGMAMYAREFYRMGCNVLLPHNRAHCKSQHRYVGMGWLDRLDIVDWIDWIIEREPEAKIVLHGVSMGGATVMMTTGEKLPANVKCAIEDCGYTSVWDEFSDVIRDRGMPPVPLLYTTDAAARLFAGYGLKKASSVNQLKKSKTPTLFIHGEEDTFVPFYMLRKNYDAAACEKKLVSIPGAVHANAHMVDPKTYWSEVRAHIEKYTGCCLLS